MLSKENARRMLEAGEVDPRPFKLQWTDGERRRGAPSVDFYIDLDWNETTRQFAAVFAPVATPKKVDAAIREAEAYVSQSKNRFPLVLLPHISDETSDRLLSAGISGLDFSGNVVISAGDWLVVRTGNSNRFPSSQPIKNVYEGKSALVGRVLLRRPSFDMVRDVREEIERRGASIAMGTVSKVLSALEEDLIIRKNGGIRLIQPDQLLDQLSAHYTLPTVTKRLEGKAVPGSSFFAILTRAADQAGVRVVGQSEVRHVVAPTSQASTTLYVSRLGDWIHSVPFEETPRFANVIFLETPSNEVFFDATVDDNLPWCSALQTYLELMRGGKREREAASQIREQILGKT